MRRFSGLQVRSYRVSNGFRVESLAAAVGKSAASIHSYESGRVDPPSSVVADLAAALGCDPGDLYQEGPPTQDVQRLVDQAVDQGHSETITDAETLARVAAVLKSRMVS